MSSSLDPVQDGRQSTIAMRSFQISMWAMCGLATCFLGSRFILRISTKGKLMLNDYFLVPAILLLYLGAGLLQSTIPQLYRHAASGSSHQAWHPTTSVYLTSRITASIEMLWIVIYCVKFCFLAQFKFHKPPYAFVSPRFTRYYWSSMAICTAAFLFTLLQPIILCPNTDHCLYFSSSGPVSWEIAVSTIDIIVDLFVISIPICLVYMANFTRLHTIINASFKGLSVFSIAVAATRLALQIQPGTRGINYIWVTFFLIVEACTALIMASISSYRTVIIDRLNQQRTTRGASSQQPKARGFLNVALGERFALRSTRNSSTNQGEPLSEFLTVHSTPSVAAASVM